ncbi:hypothetical protein D5086_018072 [Populus alba]|uniref:Uncharacterized protein n=1 Tax=Populus alba TaxID=43335 RepID=A0ACC4BQ22_POPAL
MQQSGGSGFILGLGTRGLGKRGFIKRNHVVTFSTFSLSHDPSPILIYLHKLKHLLVRSTGCMIAGGVTPDSISYNTLINGFVREDHMDKAFHWMNRMEKEGLLPDIITYNVVMNGFCRHQEAELVLRKMIKKGIDPGRSAYTALIN